MTRYAFAVTDKRTRKIARLFHRYVLAIYGRREDAQADCAKAQIVRRVRIKVLPNAADMKGILK